MTQQTEWQPIDTAPTDGTTIEVRGIMRVHYMQGSGYAMMPDNWRPDTPKPNGASLSGEKLLKVTSKWHQKVNRKRTMAGGRPKGVLNPKPWADAIRKAIAKRNATSREGLEALAENLLKCAEAGEGWAFAEIGNRLDGKPHQTSETHVTSERYVVRGPEPVKDVAEWVDKHVPKVH